MRKLVILLLLIGVAIFFFRDKRTFVDEMNDARATLTEQSNEQYVRVEGSWRIRAMAYFEHKTAFAIVPFSLKYSDDKTFNANVRFSSNRCVFTTTDINLLKWNNCGVMEISFPCRTDANGLIQGVSAFFLEPYRQGCGNPDFDRQIDKYRLSEEMSYHKVLYPACRIKTFQANKIAFECDIPIEEIGVEKVKYLVVAERMSK